MELNDLQIEEKDLPVGMFKGANFFTPRIIGYYTNNMIYCEISESTERTIPSNSVFLKMFGVTFSTLTSEEIIRLYDISGATFSLEDAYKKAAAILL